MSTYDKLKKSLKLADIDIKVDATAFGSGNIKPTDDTLDKVLKTIDELGKGPDVNFENIVNEYQTHDGTPITIENKILRLPAPENIDISGKVDKVEGKQLSDENYTLDEKQKLAGLESSKWLGLYPNITDLENAHPTALAGNYADVDAGVGSDTIRYVWDVSDDKFVQSGSGASLTHAQIKQMYESNPDTNVFTDDEKLKLASITEIFTTALKNAYDNAVTWISTNGQNLLDHLGLTNNPHNVTKDQVGLSNVPNVDFTSAVNANTEKISYTDKSKVDGIENGAQVNTIEDIKIDGVSQPITNKSIDLDTTLQLSSTIVTDTDLILDHQGGLNEVDSATDVTITIQTFTAGQLKVGRVFLYQQKGEGKIIINYASGVTGESVQTYAKGQMITLRLSALNTWSVLNPPRENTGTVDGLQSTATGETMPVIPFNNIVQVYNEDFDESQQVNGTYYVLIPKPIIPTMSMEQFGSIISGWEGAGIVANNHGDEISVWEDSYGVVNLTSADPTKTTLHIENGKRHVDFQVMNFIGGKPESLNFIAGTNSFSFVVQMGSRFDRSAIDETFLSWANGNGASYQYSFGASSSNRLEGYVGGKNFNRSLVRKANTIYIMTYDALTDTISLYENSTLLSSGVISSSPVNQTTYDFLVGGRQETYDRVDGIMTGLWIYDGVLDQTAINDINNHIQV